MPSWRCAKASCYATSVAEIGDVFCVSVWNSSSDRRLHRCGCHRWRGGGVLMSITSTRGAIMSSTPRIAKAEITGVYGYVLKRFSRKLFGDVPEPAEVMWHNRAVLTDSMGFGRKVQKWHQLDASAGLTGVCSTATRTATITIAA